LIPVRTDADADVGDQRDIKGAKIDQASTPGP